MNRYISEFIGTFALIFVGTGAIVINQETGGTISHVGIAISFGLIVMAMIYAIGDISGAHINPAVTIAFWFAKKFETKDVLPYIIAQLLGAFLGSITLAYLFPNNEYLGATIPAGSENQSAILELILTFLLMFVIIQVSTGSKEKGIMAGLTIGGVVLLEAMFAGPICGASMNPARSIAPAIVSGHSEHLWLYIVAPIVGALLAISTCRLIGEKECCEGEC